jgi:diguanylate cyclase (GGDEF)-like protein/PAS domain S-box-containing protein
VCADTIDLQLRWHHQFQFADIVEIGHVNPWRLQHMANAFIQTGMANDDQLLQGFFYSSDAGKERLIRYLKMLGGLAFFVSTIVYAAYRSIKRENQQRKRLAKELQQRTDELVLHNLVLQKINQNVDLIEFLNELAQQVEKLHPAMLCSILLLDDRNVLRHAASPSLPDAYKLAVDGLIIGEGVGSCGTAAYRGEHYIIDDVQQHPYCLAFHDLAKRIGVKTCWSQPIKNNQGNVLGTFAVYYAEIHAINAAEIELMESYAVLAQIGIDHIEADTALYENEQCLRFVLKGSGVGFWDWKIDSHKVKIHTIESEVRRYHYEEISTTIPHWLNFIHLDDREKTWQSILDVLNGRLENHQIEYRIIDNKGDIHWVLDKASIVQRNPNGTPQRMSGTHTDITERKLSERYLHASEQRLMLCQEYGGIGTWEIDFASQRQNWSPTACKLLGFPNLENPEWSDFMGKVHHDDWTIVINATQYHFEQGEKYDVEYRIIDAEQERWIRSVGSVDTSEFDDEGKPRYFRGIVQDITERKLAEQQIEKLAFYDPLTQLPNRRLLNELLHRNINISRRTGEQLAVLMLDLDYFKAVNDSLGHSAGDELLQQVAERISKQLRKVDTVARLGGDEFVVLLTSLLQQQDIIRVTSVIINELHRPFLLRQTDSVQIGTSIGISFYPQHGDTLEVLMDVADSALYKAKKQGRGCFCIAD